VSREKQFFDNRQFLWQQPAAKNEKQFVFIELKKMKFILSSETKCPKFVFY